MTKTILLSLLGATALTSAGAIASAGGLTAAVDEGVVAAQLSKAATFAGRTGAAAFAIGPE